MYRITIMWFDEHEEAVFFPVEEYEISHEKLTLAIDKDHDIVFPLNRVKSVDIVRE